MALIFVQVDVCESTIVCHHFDLVDASKCNAYPKGHCDGIFHPKGAMLTTSLVLWLMKLTRLA